MLDLRDSAHLKIAEEILGPLPDSAKYKSRDGYYLLRIPLGKVLRLADEGIELDQVRSSEPIPSTDSLPEKPPEADSTRGQ